MLDWRKTCRARIQRVSDALHEIEGELDDLLVQVDPAGRMLYVSPSAASSLGLSPEECLGRSLWEFVSPEDRQSLQATMTREVARHAEHWEQEGELVSLKGPTTSVKWVVWAHYEPAGKLDHLNVIGHDITEQRRAERSLADRLTLEALIMRLSTHFNRLSPPEVDAGVLQALQEIGEFAGVDRAYVFRFSEEGRYLNNTHEWCRPGIEPQMTKLQHLPSAKFPWWLERLRRHEAIHLPDVTALPEEAARAQEVLLMQGIQSLLAVPLVYERQVIGFLGFDAVRSPKTWSDETRALLSIVADMLANVFHRQEAEEALRRTTASLAAAQRIAHIGHWEEDLLTGRTTWSDEIYRLLGYEPHSVEPGLKTFEVSLHPDDRSRVIETLRRAIDAQAPLNLDCRITRPDGTVRMLHIQGEVGHDEMGWPLYTRGTIQDTTELRQAEAELARREAELQQSRELDRIKTEFVSAVSHELRTPLSSIKGYAEFLADELSGPLNDDQHGYVCQIEEGAARLERIINDLLDFARLEAGTFTLNMRTADLAETIGEIVSGLGPQAASRQLEVETELTGPLPVRMDPERIGQVLMNLLSNALKFTRPGGRISVAAARIPGEIRVEIRDTGIGIPAERLTHVFQKFYQVDTSLTREVGGAGLGLSIAQALVEAHGGRIGVVSTPEVGTTFWFTLPLNGA